MESNLAHGIMFVCEIGFTIGVSHLSFHYFEALFNSKRKTFVMIESTNESPLTIKNT